MLTGFRTKASLAITGVRPFDNVAQQPLVARPILMLEVPRTMFPSDCLYRNAECIDAVTRG
jgi:hypothetical protein